LHYASIISLPDTSITSTAMTNPRPVEGFVRPNLGFRCSRPINSPHSDNLSLCW